MSDLEIRQFSNRAAKPTVDSDNRLSGRAAPFNSFTLIGNKKYGFREKIHPKAFNKTMNDGDQVLLDNHDARRPLARVSAGTLETHVTGAKGWDWRATPANTSYAQDVLENVRAGNYGGCSFAFEVVSERWNEDTDDGIPERELLEVNCREISICTFPAYADTSVDARSQVDMAMEYRARYWAPVMENYFEDRDDRDSKKPYGDVAYADPKNGKYPIDTKEHVKAAWSYINMPKNASKYPLNGVTLSSVKAKIRAAAKKFGIQISDDEKNSADETVIEVEGFKLVVADEYDERQLAKLQDEFTWFLRDFRATSECEPDDPTRALTKEEHSRAVERAIELRKAHLATLRAEQALIWGK